MFSCTVVQCSMRLRCQPVTRRFNSKKGKSCNAATVFLPVLSSILANIKFENSLGKSHSCPTKSTSRRVCLQILAVLAPGGKLDTLWKAAFLFLDLIWVQAFLPGSSNSSEATTGQTCSLWSFKRLKPRCKFKWSPYGPAFEQKVIDGRRRLTLL